MDGRRGAWSTVEISLDAGHQGAISLKLLRGKMVYFVLKRHSGRAIESLLCDVLELPSKKSFH